MSKLTETLARQLIESDLTVKKALVKKVCEAIECMDANDLADSFKDELTENIRYSVSEVDLIDSVQKPISKALSNIIKNKLGKHQT